MKKWLLRIVKWLFGIILGSILLITIALYFFKDDIINYAVGEVNKNLNTKVEVSKVDLTFWATFPNLSIDFNQVFIQDAVPNSTRKDTLLYTNLLRLKFSPFDIWNEEYKVKEITVDPGVLNIRIDEKGEGNYNIIKESKEEGDSNFELNLESIYLRKIRFAYSNKQHEQYAKTLLNEVELDGNFTADQTVIHGETDFRIVRFENGKVPLVVRKNASLNVDLKVDQVANTVKISNGKLNLQGIPFNWNLFLDTTELKLSIDAKDLPLQDVANSLAVNQVDEVKKLNGNGIAFFKLKLLSKLKEADSYPEIDCAFGIKNGKLKEPSNGIQLSNISLDGNYSTLKGKGNEELVLKQFGFNSFSGPFSGNLKITEFQAPKYKGAVKGSIDLGIIHGMFHLPKIDQLNGVLGIDSRFYLETIVQDDQSAIEIKEGSGSAQLRNVLLQLENDSRKFHSINGNLDLNRHEAILHNCSIKIGQSDFELNGSFNEIDAFLQDKANLQVSVLLESRNIDLSDFNNTISTTSSTSKDIITKEWMLPEKISGNARLSVHTMKLQEHVFETIQAEMEVGNRSILLRKLHGITSQASVTGTVGVIETAPEYFELSTNLSSNNIQFKPLFKEWNNFDQNVITADNISGKAEAILDLKAPFDFTTGIMQDDIIAQLQLKVNNGRLQNVETFKELTKSLKTPKTRAVLSPKEIEALEGKLNNISFETLENTIYIKNSKVIIPKMDIKSSALDITTEGIHHFSNQIDYKFSFRLRELKIQRDESEFGEVIDDESGMKLWVRMYGDLDNPTIEWDKNSRKESKKEEFQAQKNEAISILKSEFGLFKKDTTIKAYQPKQAQPREELKIEFGKEEKVDPVEEKKKTNKLKETLKNTGKKLQIEKPKPAEDFEIEM
ncbi:MAG: AsmA-like C-terminal region-containing protein [Fluviicola sp.]